MLRGPGARLRIHLGAAHRKETRLERVSVLLADLFVYRLSAVCTDLRAHRRAERCFSICRLCRLATVNGLRYRRIPDEADGGPSVNKGGNTGE